MATLISNSGTWKVYLEYYVLKYIGRKFRLWLVERKWLWKIEQDGYVVLYKHRLFELKELYFPEDVGLEENIRRIVNKYLFDKKNVIDIVIERNL